MVVPRITRLMALAIHFDGLIQSGAVANCSELARLGNVTRARMTQIMNLLMLAPGIQEALLFLRKRTANRRVGLAALGSSLAEFLSAGAVSFFFADVVDLPAVFRVRLQPGVG